MWASENNANKNLCPHEVHIQGKQKWTQTLSKYFLLEDKEDTIIIFILNEKVEA